jgi:cytochrome P450
MATLPPPKHSSARSTWHWLLTPYAYLDELSREFGDAFRLPLFRFEIAVFSNPEHVREIFADSGDVLEAGRVNHVLAPLLGDRSVLMADGKDHLRKRKLLLPPFQGERMQAYGKVMLDFADDAIDAFPYGTAFPLHGAMQEVTLRVIIRTIFGFTGPEAEAMARRVKAVLKRGSWTPMILPFMQFDLGRFSPYGRFKLASAASDEQLYREIARRRRDGSRGSDILSLLLDARDEAGEPMPERELRDELVTLLVAGHETTATGLTWAMRWLLAAPELLDELAQELEALGPDPSPAAIAKSELLDGVVREALRLVPVVPMVGRMLAKPAVVAGYSFEPGDVVGCAVYLAHRRPDVYPDPDRFDPRRFARRKPSPAEYIPFGGGVRRCIGMAFALYEMKMVLARLVTRTRLRLVSGDVAQKRRSVTITPAHGLPVVLERRRLRPALRPREDADRGRGPTINV